MRLQPRPLRSLTVDKCSLGCPVLDAFLGGGLPCGSIVEITGASRAGDASAQAAVRPPPPPSQHPPLAVLLPPRPPPAGEPAASKTQICLQALLAVQLPRGQGGLGGSAVYLYTEGEPAMRRLRELAAALPLRAPPGALAALPDPTANVFLEKGVRSGEELLAALGRLRQLLLRQREGPRPVRLVVVDSVGHVFRGELGDRAGTAELAGRTELLFRLSALLRWVQGGGVQGWVQGVVPRWVQGAGLAGWLGAGCGAQGGAGGWAHCNTAPSCQ